MGREGGKEGGRAWREGGRGGREGLHRLYSGKKQQLLVGVCVCVTVT